MDLRGKPTTVILPKAYSNKITPADIAILIEQNILQSLSEKLLAIDGN